MGKPGVMFYFDIRPCIKRLSCEEKGQLFEAILDYGEFGTVPEFEGTVGVAWDFIQPRLDRDTERYEQKTDKSKYAVYVREARKHDIQPLSFDDWAGIPDNEKHQLLSPDVGSYPTPTSTSTSTPNSNIVCNEQPTQFTPPTLQEVADYCREKGYTIDPERFVSYYSSIGWMVGKNSMKDWKAAACAWERSEGRGSNGSGNRGNYTPPDDDLVKYF